MNAADNRNINRRSLVPLASGLMLALLIAGSAAGAGVISKVSTGPGGVPADNGSYRSAISADGRYVAFESDATDLVSGDTNGVRDIFIRDTLTGVTSRISTDSANSESNSGGSAYYWQRGSHDPSISADGRYVAFYSGSSNLIPNDTNGTTDIFVKDTWTGSTARVSTDSAGIEANNAGAFEVTRGSYSPAISADGHYVSFESNASNLVTGDTNSSRDIFRKDRQTGAVVRISADGAGIGGNDDSSSPSISSDGRFVAFSSKATNVVPAPPVPAGNDQVYVKDLHSGAVSLVSRDYYGNPALAESLWPSISADGRYVAFFSRYDYLVVGDTNGLDDIFVRDTWTGSTVRASTDSAGAQVHGYHGAPSISADGRYVAFASDANDLVPLDTNWIYQVFVKDLQTGAVAITSVNGSGSPADWDCFFCEPAISADGRFVSFESNGSNLVPGDTWDSDVFLSESSISCAAGKPSLGLMRTAVHWASYADYSSNLLSVDFEVANNSPGVAYIVQVTSSSANNGVTCATCPPPVAVSLGNLVGGASHQFTLKYTVPDSVPVFNAALSASAKDGCGNGYTYP